ncbi:MAG: Bax inhibitor-1/YccA family protein [Defluviitaleaceae bacterium]|nr:Bax inhibitor-1/YccA family protein [Defluviitaleaceae bacterium]
MDYYDNSQVIYDVDSDGVNRYVAKVFGWMFLGLLMTALSTFAIVIGIGVSDAFAAAIAALSQGIFIIFLIQVLLVGYLSVRVEKMTTSTATALYLIYAIVNGLTFGLFALLYAGSANMLVTAFSITAISFGVMAVYGLKTKQDLTRAGNLLRMGLIGIIVMSIVNIFLGSGALDFFICIAGLFIFLGLTAHHTHRIKHFYYHASSTGDAALGHNLAIIGALSLYLSFINLFMFILRLLTGGRR